MGEIRDFKDLNVWQSSRLLVKRIYELTRLLPKEEQFALSSQINRAVISIPSNIAEGYGRNYLPEYMRFLKIAKGSCYEVETQIILCEDLGYLTSRQVQDVLSLIRETERLLIALLDSLATKTNRSLQKN